MYLNLFVVSLIILHIIIVRIIINNYNNVSHYHLLYFLITFSISMPFLPLASSKTWVHSIRVTQLRVHVASLCYNAELFSACHLKSLCTDQSDVRNRTCLISRTPQFGSFSWNNLEPLWCHPFFCDQNVPAPCFLKQQMDAKRLPPWEQTLGRERGLMRMGT